MTAAGAAFIVCIESESRRLLARWSVILTTDNAGVSLDEKGESGPMGGRGYESR